MRGDVPLRDGPGDVADAARAERVGREARDVDVDRLAGFARARQGRRGFGLERFDAAAAFEPGGDTGDEAAAADAHERAIGHAGVVFDFRRQRSAPVTTSSWS